MLSKAASQADMQAIQAAMKVWKKPPEVTPETPVAAAKVTPDSIRAITSDTELRAAAKDAGLSEKTITKGYDEMGVDWLKDKIVEKRKEGLLKDAYERANSIGEAATKGQPDSVREAAQMAAYENARQSIEKTGEFNPEFMRKSAMKAAGKESEKLGTTLDEPIGESGATAKDRLASEAAAPDVAANLSDIERIAGEERAKLDPKHQELLRLTEEGATDAEIASELGYSEKSVKQIRSKAKQQWREATERRLEAEESPAVKDVRGARPAGEVGGDPLGIVPHGATTKAEAIAESVRDIGRKVFFGEYGRIKSASGETAMRAKLQGDIDLGMASAALRKFKNELMDAITVKKPWWLPRKWVPEYRKFVGEILPAARYLNATGRTAGGDFIFEPFEMRAGSVPAKQVRKTKLAIGDVVPTKNTRSGVVEPLRVSEILSDGRAQLVRDVTAADQNAVLTDFQLRHPDNAWVLEKFIDPDLAKSRVEYGGVEMADFNRHALSEMYEIDSLPGYTPDVLMERGLAGSIVNWLRASSLPGKRYKTGAAAESAKVEDLFRGFFTRQAELLKNQITTKASLELLDAAARKHKQGDPIPDGWVEYKTGIEGLVNRIAQTRGKLASDLGIDGRMLSGAARKYEGKNYIIPQTTLDVLNKQLAFRKMDNVMVKGAQKIVSDFNKGLLARPMSALLNQLTNEIFIGMDAARNGMTSMVAAATGDIPLAKKHAEIFLRESKGYLTDRWYNRDYRKAMDDVLPPELFEGQNLIDAISVEGRPSTSIADLALKAMRYSEIDKFGKQRLASAYLKTYAREAAQAAADTGAIPDTSAARQQFAVDWMRKSPDRVKQDIMLTTNLMLGNYADAPMWLKTFNRAPLAGAVAPFVNFKYQLLRQQATLATGALRETLRKSDPNATEWWTEKRIKALADLLTVTTAVGAPAWWLSQDDEEGRKIGTAKDEEGRPLPAEEVTANRIKANILARHLALNTDENDWWLYTRNFPYLNEAAMIAAYRRDGTFEAENFFGDMISQGVAWKATDLLMGKKGKYDQYESSSAKLGKLSTEFALGSVLPLPWLQMAREVNDPFRRQTTALKTKPLPMSDFMAGATNVVPGSSQALPKKIRKTGEEIRSDTSSPAVVKFVSPINLKSVKKD